ncbi:MAG TPA: S8/S53 family peptidase [Streptosporangiaceae bacterium]
MSTPNGSNNSPPDNGGNSSGNGQDDNGRLDIQIQLIRDALGDEVGVALKDDGSLDYLFVRQTVLVRDEYLSRAQDVLFGRDRDPDAGLDFDRGRQDPGDSPGVIAGVTLISLHGRDGGVPVAMNDLDDALGVGAATPSHILSVTPGHCCPATEPDPVPGTALPDPGVCEGGGGGVLIDIPDTGFIKEAAAHHPWLAGVSGTPDPLGQGDIKEYGGHGTFIAGVARCMAPLATVRVTSDFSKGGALSEHKLVRRLNEALTHGPDIISLSAGGATRKDLPLLGFEAFWRRYRHHKNVVLVAAAGNNSSRRPFWPAAFPQVVSVGALSADRQARAHFSDFGSWVDVYAPGEDLVNAFGTGLYTYREPPHIGEQRHFHGMARWSGTSFSTPLVAGLIAARMTLVGETARDAAQALLAHAAANRIPGVGPVLRPCETGGGRCACRCHTDCRGCCCGAG